MKANIPMSVRIVIITTVVILLTAAAIFLLRPADTDGGVYMTVYFLDVGQGDAALIMTPEGSILIDAGTNASEVDLIAALKKAGVHQLDCAVFTHAHEDHIGGADAVLSAFGADHVLLPEIAGEDAAGYVYERLLTHLPDTAELIRITDKTDLHFGPVGLTVFPPDAGDLQTSGNEASLVIRVSYKDVSFLFMGDTEKEQEDALIERYGDSGELKSTVLRVGHHGSDTSTGDEFLDAVAPDYAIISVGAGNSYGHPTSRVLTRLSERGIRVFRTDTDGTLIMKTDGQSVTISAGKQASEASRKRFIWQE